MKVNFDVLGVERVDFRLDDANLPSTVVRHDGSVCYGGGRDVVTKYGKGKPSREIY